MQAIYGRPLGYGEANRIVFSENLVAAYRSRKASENWSEWAEDNPYWNTMLIEAMKLAGAEDG